MTDPDAKIPVDPWTDATPGPQEQPPRQGAGLTFSLASLLLLMTLLAAFLGVAVWNQAAGVALALLLIPAFVRTIRIHARRKAQGQIPSFAERVFIFARSLGAVLVIVGVSAGILWAVQAPLVAHSDLGGVMLGGLVALIASGTVGVLLIRGLWSIKD